jgi:hypothetical protein
MIPVRLIVSIAIVAAIAFMVVIASSNLRVLLAEQQVEKECRSLESSLCTMLSSGAARDIDETGAAEGTKRIQTFSLPDSLVYLCFGGDPDFSGTGVFQPDLIEDGTVIVYKVEGGSNKVMWLPKETCKFREGTIVDNKWVIAGTGQSYIIHSGGKITLVFECVQKSHQVYILIHGNDGISP